MADYYHHEVAALAAHTHAGMDAMGMSMGMGMTAHDGGGGGGGEEDGDKPLTSRYRGVCWNKKNRRWQSAINSSGKYIYLGSFLEEEEAAKMFDRAAIRLRGNKAKLNFSISEYMDANGELLDDPRITTIIFKAEGAVAAGKAARAGGGGGMGGDDSGMALALTAGSGGARGMGGGGGGGGGGALDYGGGGGSRGRSHGAASGGGHHASRGGGQQHMAMTTAGGGAGAAGGAGAGGAARGQPAGGFTVPANAFKGRAINPLDVPLPSGCTLEATVPGEDDAFGILYLDPGSQRHLGAVIWDGFASQDLGVFDTDRDARTACNSALRIVLQYKNQNALLLQSLAESMLPGAGPSPSSALGGASVAPLHHQAPQAQNLRRPSSPSGIGFVNGLYQDTVSLDSLGVHGGGGHHIGIDATSLPLAMLSTGAGGLGTHGGYAVATGGGFGTGLGGISAAAAGGLKQQASPPNPAQSQRSYAELFSFLSNYPKGTSAGGGGGAGKEGDDVAATTAAVVPNAGGDIAGLLAQMNSGAGAGGGEGGAGTLLPGGVPLMLGRVSSSGQMVMLGGAPGGAAGGSAQQPKRLSEDEDGGAGKRQRGEGAPGAAPPPPPPPATVAVVAPGGSVVALGGVPSEFSQMKSMANLSVQEAMRQLAAEGRL